ncbi:unnamed protein product [Aspergillus oryzae]|nr:unnamed protein product [Aspergillus oryzae]GMF83932.1 unnamed protein product [Aspergillus oryzae]
MEKIYDHPDGFAIQGAELRPDTYDGNSSARSSRARTGSRLYEPESSTASAFSLYETQINNARSAERPDNKEVVYGPLLNYRYTEGNRWHGSVMIVTKRGGIPRSAPTLLLRRSISETDSGNHLSQPDADTRFKGLLLYSNLRMNFWRFDICLRMGSTERRWEYTITEVFFLHRLRGLTHSFVVPSYNESMRIMFYSCNGWCDGAEAGKWNHLSLWKNVLSRHAENAFHVM